MGWIEQTAWITACRFTRTPMQLERIEDLQFLCPMRVGDRVCGHMIGGRVYMFGFVIILR